jgi:hypothetical protein
MTEVLLSSRGLYDWPPKSNCVGSTPVSVGESVTSAPSYVMLYAAWCPPNWTVNCSVSLGSPKKAR